MVVPVLKIGGGEFGMIGDERCERLGVAEVEDDTASDLEKMAGEDAVCAPNVSRSARYVG